MPSWTYFLHTWRAWIECESATTSLSSLGSISLTGSAKSPPQRDASRSLTGVFSTRSPDRPNPVGLHRVKVLAIDPGRVHIGPIEAIDGTPVIDIKPLVE
jgi:tRNA (Thr-GGU) A37 N-methylase